VGDHRKLQPGPGVGAAPLLLRTALTGAPGSRDCKACHQSGSGRSSCLSEHVFAS
jgi:hypothetical protein